MAAGRRSAHPVPPFGRLFKQGLQEGQAEDMRRAGELLERYLRGMSLEAYNGLPAPHGSTHGDSDPLPDTAYEDAELLAWVSFQRADSL
jgi:hypothetical protein